MFPYDIDHRIRSESIRQAISSDRTVLSSDYSHYLNLPRLTFGVLLSSLEEYRKLFCPSHLQVSHVTWYTTILLHLILEIIEIRRRPPTTISRPLHPLNISFHDLYQILNPWRPPLSRILPWPYLRTSSVSGDANVNKPLLARVIITRERVWQDIFRSSSYNEHWILELGQRELEGRCRAHHQC